MIKEYEQLNEIAERRLINSLPSLQIRRAGSACRSMMEAFNAALADIYIDVLHEINQADINSASADNLTRIGETYGVFRAPHESDDVYRERVIKSFVTNTMTTKQYILENVYRYNNVAEVIYKPYVAGNGTFVLYIVPVNSSISDTELRSIQNTVNSSVAAGCRGIVKRAVVLSVQLKVNLIFSDPADTTRRNDIRNRCANELVNYINTRKAGQPLIINEIRRLAMNTDDSISDISIEYIRINGNNIILKNYYTKEYEVLRPAVNAAVIVA